MLNVKDKKKNDKLNDRRSRKEKDFVQEAMQFFQLLWGCKNWPAKDSTKLANLHAFVLFSQDEKED